MGHTVADVVYTEIHFWLRPLLHVTDDISEREQGVPVASVAAAVLNCIPSLGEGTVVTDSPSCHLEAHEVLLYLLDLLVCPDQSLRSVMLVLVAFAPSLPCYLRLRARGSR